MRAVVASVNYGDFLAMTLPAWLRVLPSKSLTVVTNAQDIETQAVAQECGARLFITDAWTRVDPTYRQDTSHWTGLRRERGQDVRRPVLNKALALDEALGFIGDCVARPRRYEVCLSIDADCLPVGQIPREDDIAAGTIYGCRRYDGRPDLTRGDEIVLKGRICRGQHRFATAVGGGYFQMFRWEPSIRFGSYPAADGYDYDLAHRFHKGVVLESVHVLHFGETHRNWEGRKTARFVPQVSQ